MSTKHLAVASLVASLFGSACGTGATGTPTGSSSKAVVKCQGVNACAAQGACAGAVPDGGMHACAGQNACKGQGWIEVPSAAECTTKGGTVLG